MSVVHYIKVHNSIRNRNMKIARLSSTAHVAFEDEHIKSLRNLVALVMILHPITHIKYLSDISPDNPTSPPL